MDADTAQLDAIAARLRTLDSVGTAIAEDARADIEAEAKRTAAAGTTPYGEAWQPTKSGKRPLENAASKVSAVVSGVTTAVITLVLRGVEVFHDAAKGKSLPRRQILPTPGEVPARMKEIIARSAKKIVARRMGGHS